MALGDPARAHGPDQVIDCACRDAVHMRLQHDRGERLLGDLGWFENARKIKPLRSFGMRSSTVPARVSQVQSL